MVACVQDEETIRYFNNVNSALGDDVSLAFLSPYEGSSARKLGGPAVDNGNAILEASLAGRQRFAGASLRRTACDIPQGSCSHECKCSCHKAASYPIPFVFRRALKKMFPKFVDDPVLIRRCNTPKCRGLRAKERGVLWVLHSAFISRAVVLSAISRGLRFTLHLKTYPVVAETSNMIQFAVKGNVEGMKGLILSKGGTPCDTSRLDGWSALHVSMHTISIEKQLTQ